jgi:acyl-CoA synthetase (AMP-forming)/AMP-acid ligase II
VPKSRSFVRSSISEQLDVVLAIDADADEIEYDDHWWTWSQIADTANEVSGYLRSIDAPRGAEIGLLMSNRPSVIAALVSLLRDGFCVVTINPGRRGPRLGEDLEKLMLPVIIGDSQIIGSMESLAPRGTRFVSLGQQPLVRSAEEESHAFRQRSGVAIRMLTSGTTGPPKRVDLSYRMLETVFQGAKFYESKGNHDVRLRSGVVIVSAPLAHLGGVFRTLQAVLDGRRVALLDRFEVESWVALVRKHRPKSVSLVPTALKMVLEAQVDPEVFSSVQSVVCGTAPIDADVADIFAEKYGVAVLVSFAATEFGGGVAGWTLEDYRRLWKSKRGSVGRAHAGCELRVVDRDSGATLPFGETGLLEIRSEQFDDSSKWTRTTDVARMDEDGFLWVIGRADETINRGGLKIQPDDVRAVLERQPGVRTAAVVGMPSERLGQVPVAVIEPIDGAKLIVETILEEASKDLARYELPVEVIIVEELPRTDSQKVSLDEVRVFLGGRTYP